MGKWSGHIKDRACELAEGYQEARTKEFDMDFRDWLIDDCPATLSEDDVKGFIESFTFPTENEWALAQAEAEVAEMEDARRQLAKDER